MQKAVAKGACLCYSRPVAGGEQPPEPVADTFRPFPVAALGWEADSSLGSPGRTVLLAPDWFPYPQNTEYVAVPVARPAAAQMTAAI